jgi:hypothetical protein
MNIRTLSVTVPVERDALFNFLADIENFPRWSGGYCERIYLQRGGWCALTMEGEVMVRLHADSATGVIDFYAELWDQATNQMPVRVLALSPRCTVASFTLIGAPDQSPETYEARFALLRESMQELVRRFGGGAVHDAGARSSLVESGLN